MSGNTRSAGRNQRNNPYQIDDLFVKFHRTPAGIAWRWRAELAILALLGAALWRLSLLITITWAGLVVAALLGLLAGVPHSRRFITRRFWCVLARHRAGGVLQRAGVCRGTQAVACQPDRSGSVVAFARCGGSSCRHIRS